MSAGGSTPTPVFLVHWRAPWSNRKPLSPATISSKRSRRIVDEFELVDSWIERYETLIDFGRRLAPMPASLRTDRNRIRSCQGDAWLAGTRRGGRPYLSAASETGVLAGLLAIVVEVYSARAAEDMLNHPLVVLEATGLSERLSPHRLAAYREILARLSELAS